MQYAPLHVTVIGCGHGGQALAADLSMRGCHVTLYADSDHPGDIDVIARRGDIECRGVLTGTGRIHHATTDLAQAMRVSSVVILSLPSYSHESMFVKMLPYLQPHQIVATLAANFSSLCFQRILDEQRCTTPVILADFASLPYACRADGCGVVDVLAVKKQMALACLQPLHAQAVIRRLGPVFPTKLDVCNSVLELGLNITSGISHPITALMNAGRIGANNDEFYFYKEGVSPATAQLLERLDNDRRLIGRAWGFELPSYLELMAEFYGTRYSSIYEFFQCTKVHNKMKLCPKSLEDRYIEQDVPYVIVPWYCLGRAKQIDSEMMRNVISWSSMINGRDYLQQGRNLNAMGLPSAYQQREAAVCGWG